MLVGKLSEHLKHLISETRKATDGVHRSYHNSLEGKSSLNELSNEVLALCACSASTEKGRGHRPSSSSLQLLKKIILTQFELLCVSAELQDDVEYAFSECRCLCEHTALFNAKMTSNIHTSNQSHKYLQFADFADVAISTQTQLLLNAIVHDPSIMTIVSLAKFEHNFISALTAIFATFTSLFIPPVGSQRLKTVFVSEEMFSMAQKSTLSWLDCLIPGAQSEVLRLTVKDLLASLWGRVASHLVAVLQPLTVGGEHTEAVVALYRDAMEHPELEHHSAVKKCLWYTLTSIQRQQSISVWDQGFQAVLVASPQDTRKNFKPTKSSEAHTTQSTHLFLTQMLLPLLKNHDTNKPLHEPSQHETKSKVVPSSEVISYHIDELRITHMHTAALQISIEHIARYLIQGLKKCLASMNMRGVGQLLMVDGCGVVSSLSKSVLHLAQASCPLYLLPPCSRLHFTEHCSRSTYALAYDNFAQLKDSLELTCVWFHDKWQSRCDQLLQASFPRPKFWRSLNRSQSHSQEPGSYCNLLIEEVLLPAMEAARGITDQKAQLSFLLLTINVFLSRLRKIITTNKQTYSSSAGRQLLTDFRHLRHWLLSPDLSLPQQATQLLSNLPALCEIEGGLLEVCGTADKTVSGGHTSPDWGELWSSVPYVSQLSVCREQAWATERDWADCVKL